MMHKYKKILKKETGGLDVAKIYSEQSSGSSKKDDKSNGDKKDDPQNTKFKKKKSAFQKAKLRLADQIDEKAKREEDFQKKQTERATKIKAYQEKKEKRYNVIKARNKKGQPLMGGRIELLLEKIQQST